MTSVTSTVFSRREPELAVQTVVVIGGSAGIGWRRLGVPGSTAERFGVTGGEGNRFVVALAVLRGRGPEPVGDGRRGTGRHRRLGARAASQYERAAESPVPVSQ